MLLPCSSEEYKSAMNYTQLQGVRVSAKDLKEGYTYVTKNEEHLIYLGRHMWYEIKNQYDDEKIARVGKKMHIFFNPNWDAHKESWRKTAKFKPVKSVSSTISKEVSDSCHDEFANLVDEYLKSPESSAIVEWEKHPLLAKDWKKDWDAKNRYGSRPTLNAAMEESGQFVTVSIARHQERGRRDWRTNKYVLDYDGPPRLSFRRHNIVRSDGSQLHARERYYDAQVSPDIVTDKSKFFQLYAVYENGLKKKWMA
jgi:hypothetical protein